MRFPLLLILSLAWSSACWSQLSAPVTTPASAEPSAKSDSSTGTKGAIEQRTERIHVEDSGARIDELRVGGETKTIDVQPKGGMPAYQIEPVSGERTWKILGF
jgi:hypothetical protein